MDSMAVLGPDMTRARLRSALDVLGGFSKNWRRTLWEIKRDENSSLSYAGGFTKFKPHEIGLFDTKISSEEFVNSN